SLPPGPSPDLSHCPGAASRRPTSRQSPAATSARAPARERPLERDGQRGAPAPRAPQVRDGSRRALRARVRRARHLAGLALDVAAREHARGRARGRAPHELSPLPLLARLLHTALRLPRAARDRRALHLFARALRRVVAALSRLLAERVVRLPAQPLRPRAPLP